MSYFHYHRAIGRRARGHHGLFAAAYIRGEKRTCEQTGVTKDFQDRADVAFKTCLLPAPEQVPTWVKDLLDKSSDDNTYETISNQLWQRIDALEVHPRAQLYFHDDIALPRSLPLDSAIDLVTTFVRDQIVGQDTFADVAIHWNEHNPHVHVLCPLRTFTQEGFGNKLRFGKGHSWPSLRALTQHLREQWACYANAKLHTLGIDERIDHRSYRDRDLDLVPTRKLGRHLYTPGEEQTRRVVHNLNVRAENYRRIQQNPSIIIKKLAQDHAVITREHVQTELAHYARNNQLLAGLIQEEKEQAEHELSHEVARVMAKIEAKHSVFGEQAILKAALERANDQTQFNELVTRVCQSPELIALGLGEDGRTRYTTQRVFLEEAEFISQAHRLAVTKGHRVSPIDMFAIGRQFQLSREQQQALRHLAKMNELSVLVGRAGTGKSYMLKAAAHLWEVSGYQVIGMSVSSVAAKGLAQAADIPTHTIAHYRAQLKGGRNPFSRHHVLIMDEAGMTGIEDLSVIVQAARVAGAKLVLVGDDAQLQPIGRGAPFRALVETVGFAQLTEIYRQVDKGDKHATARLAQGEVLPALSHYASKQAIAFAGDEVQAVTQLIAQWRRDVQQVGLLQSMMLAFENKTVAALNQAARQHLIQQRQLDNQTTVTFKNQVAKSITVALGERLLCLVPDAKLGLANGEFVTVEKIEGRTLCLRQDNAQTTFSLSLDEYCAFDYGYAMTVHKAQGVSRQRVGVLVSGWGWTKYLAYVAFSRHREKLRIVVNSQSIKNIGTLGERLSVGPLKDNVLDYPVSFGIRRGFGTTSLIKRCMSQLINGHIRDAFAFARHYQEAKLLFNAKQQADTRAENQVHEWASLIAQVGDYHRRIVQWFQQDSSAKQAWQLHQPVFDKRGELAKCLLAHWDVVSVAAIQNGLTASKLRGWVRQLDAKMRVNAYFHAEKDEKNALANTIFRALKSHWPALKSQAALSGMSVNEVSAQLGKQARAHFFKQVFPFLSSQEQQLVKKLAKFAHLNRQIQDLRNRMFPKALNSSLASCLPGNHRPIYRHVKSSMRNQLTRWVQQRDKLGAMLHKQQEHLSGWLTLFAISGHTLTKANACHHARESVHDVITNLDDFLGAGYTATHFPDASKRYLSEISGGWQRFNIAKRRYAQARFAKQSRQHQAALTALNNYKMLVVQTARSYARSFAQLEGGASQVKVSRSFAVARRWQTQRGQAAQTLLTHQALLGTFEPLNLVWDKVTQHANSISNLKHALPSEVTNRSIESISSQNNTNQTLFYDPISKPYQCAKTVNEALKHQAESFFTCVLGPPKQRCGHTWRYGNKGSLAVTVGGSRQGCWHSFETGEGGGPLRLLMHSELGKGLSFAQALEEGASIAGISHLSSQQTEPIQSIPAKVTVSQETNQQRQRVQRARYYVETSMPIKGTLGESYLRQVRGITGSLSEFSFHPSIRDPGGKNYPGVVVTARNSAGEVTACQTILLDPDTGQKADVAVVKRTRGVVTGSACAIHMGGGSQVILAEGPETAASLIEAAPEANIYVTLGNVGNAAHLGWLAKRHGTSSLLFAADNDGEQGSNRKLLNKVARVLQQEGVDTYVVYPNLPDRPTCDFNDLLQVKGTRAVTAALAQPVMLAKFDELMHWSHPSLSQQWERLSVQQIKGLTSFVQLKQRIEQTKSSEQRDKLEKLLDKQAERLVDDPGVLKLCQHVAPQVMAWFVTRMSPARQQQAGVTIDLGCSNIEHLVETLKAKGKPYEYLVLNYNRWQTAQCAEKRALWIGKFLAACRKLCEHERYRGKFAQHAPELFKMTKGLVRNERREREQDMDIE